MENTQALKWAGVYFGLWLLATVLGLAVVALGMALGGVAVAGRGAYFAFTPSALQLYYIPRGGAVVIVLGLLLWKFGSAAAFIKATTTAFETQTERRLNTEALKSDILSVIDDRLSDVQGEVNQVRQVVDRLNRDDAASDFEFGDD